MSELDYEAENGTSENKNSVLNSNELLKVTSENSNNETPKKTSPLKLPESDINFNCENDPKVDNISQSSVANDVEVNLSSKNLSPNVEDELEEGEIAEACEVTNPVICHHFRIGKCYFGQNCRFLHIGQSAYKMFDHSSIPVEVPPPAPYPFQLLPPPPLSKAWEFGLEEAKTLVQKARNKREADVDFEEKQLYLDFVEDQTERLNIDFHIHKPKKCVKSLKMNDKLSRAIDSDFSRKKSSKNLLNYFTSKKLYSMSWVKKKSRKRGRSRSWSLSSSRRRRSSSRCSVSSSDRSKRSRRPRTNSGNSKIMSKLERVFSRTFRKSRSRRRSISSSLSPYRSSKHISPRSYSSSSSTLSNGHSGSYSCKNLSSNYLSKPVQSVIPKLPETVSPVINCDCRSKSSSSVKASQLKNSDLETVSSKSSNMTVSSITCTSISDISDDSFLDDSPARSVRDSVSLANSFDTREKYTFLVDKNEKKIGSATKKNTTKARMPDKVNLTKYANYSKQEKVSPISFKIERKRFSNIRNFSPPFSRQPFSPLKPKIWPGYFGKLTGKRKGRKGLSNIKKCEKPISSKKPALLPSRSEKVSDKKLLEKSKLIPETDQSIPIETSRPSVRSFQPRKKRKITAEELELLKYVPNRDRDSDSQSTLSIPVKKIISNQIKPKPVAEPVKLSNVKSEQPSSTKPGSLSRREQLMEQLKAIEEAIARKKTN